MTIQKYRDFGLALLAALLETLTPTTVDVAIRVQQEMQKRIDEIVRLHHQAGCTGFVQRDAQVCFK